MTAEEYLEQRLQHQIDWYSSSSATAQRTFRRFRTIEILGAALLPFAAGVFAREDIPGLAGFLSMGVLGVVVAVSAGLLALGRYQEKWIEYRTTAESLKKERVLFVTGVPPYDDDSAFRVLVERAETLISKENTNWSQFMTAASEDGRDAP